MSEVEQGSRADLANKQKLIGDLREANEHMVGATIRAHELAEQAAEAQARAEAMALRLRESEERYRTLFDLGPFAVYSCDARGVIEMFNRRAVELWGREPALGDTDERFCGSLKLFRADGSFMPHPDCPMAEVVSGKVAEVHDAEVCIERPDGSRITVIVNIRPVRNGQGKFVSAINSFYDITERKRAEVQLASSLERERRLAETRELFIGILGHDLRNPLGAINMSAGLLLRRGMLDEHGTRTAANIVSSTQRIARLASRMLDMTRARLGGGLPIERKPTDLRDVCASVVGEFEAAIELTCDGDLTGSWDEDRLVEVLSNLVGNAIDYAAQGTPVRIEARAAGLEVVVEVTNQGKPIAPDVLPFIFEPFRRLRESEKSREHLGLGLYIAHEIVAAHGGSLQARSAEGKTTFSMRLPRSPSA